MLVGRASTSTPRPHPVEGAHLATSLALARGPHAHPVDARTRPPTCYPRAGARTGPRSGTLTARGRRTRRTTTEEPAVATVEHRPAVGTQPPIEIHRSPRRRKSASAAARDGVVVVRLPAGLAADEEERVIVGLVRRVTGASRAAARGGDAALAARAAELADTYLDGIRPTSVAWSGRMTRLYGSCTPATGTIRISRELATAPGYVLDHVLLHELVHLVVPGHSASFRALLARHPHGERADGWLEGYTAGQLAAATAVADRTPADAASADLVDDGAVS